MENGEILTLLVNAALFFIVYKLGQWSILLKIGVESQKRITENSRIIREKSIITVEQIDGIYYAYDGNDFLAQGSNPEELGQEISKRFPDKYNGARIKVKTDSMIV